jgi:hypothetical protein
MSGEGSFDSVVLFGAGASHGLRDVSPWLPPLGGELFSQLTVAFPSSWGQIPANIQHTFGSEGFEEAMAILWEDHSLQVPRLMQDMALYFLRFRPRSAGSTEYCQLAALVKSGAIKNVLFSTLNYECILELAFALQGLNIDVFGLGSEGYVPVWKLHGSCNFRNEGLQMGVGISFTGGVSFSGDVKAMQLGEADAHWRSGQTLPPAMSMYLKDKYSQTNQDYFLRLRSEWAEVVRGAENVVVVGVHPFPDDEHIWGPLADTPAKLTYVGDRTAFRGWSRKHRQGHGGTSSTPASTFSEGFQAVVSALSH